MTWRRSGATWKDGNDRMPAEMFTVDSEARQYICQNCRGAVTIVLDFHPMMGGG